ncbi:MAG TPA: hypothetical protein VK071_04005 [Tissierellales bacterium]|nr:hypothetical protein [Tissierellales bacterium]
MYNSVTLNVLSKIWRSIEKDYERSFFKKIVDFISKGFKYISKGSIIMNLFVSDNNFVREGLIYKLYCKFIDLLQSFIKRINKFVLKYKSGSFFLNAFNNLFGRGENIINTLYISLLSFGITTLFINVLKGNLKTKLNIIFAAIVFLAIVGMRFSQNYKYILDNSFTVKFIKDIFNTEDGGEKWW